MKFKLHWLTGKIEEVEGSDIADAFSKAGYGQGALRALDWYEPIEEQISVENMAHYQYVLKNCGPGSSEIVITYQALSSEEGAQTLRSTLGCVVMPFTSPNTAYNLMPINSSHPATHN